MFQHACQLYWPCLCTVGGGDSPVEAKLYAKGCMISSTLATTAHHVVDTMARRYSWPVVVKHDGLHRCEIAQSWPEADIAVLRTVERLEAAELSPPSTYPSEYGPTPTFGMSVGYFGTLVRRDGAGGDASATYFADASVCGLVRSSGEVARWMLSRGFAEGGFSGSPVFRPDGAFTGIVIQSQCWVSETPEGAPYPVVVPVMSPLHPIAADLQKLVEQP